MSRLARELKRLYDANPEPAGPHPALQTASQTGPQQVRAFVLEVARPADWRALAALWQGVQSAHGFPAPGIAVNGVDGLQLWFSLLHPTDAARALALLQALCRRYLPGLPRDRLRLIAGSDASAPPALKPATGCWAAYIAADLAPIFEETPWIDLQPGDDAQADLLMRLRSIPPADFEAALQQLQAPAAPPVAAPPAARPAQPPEAPSGLLPTAAAQAEAWRFLLGVLRDEQAPLALRVEAAKALLPLGGAGARPPPDTVG